MRAYSYMVVLGSAALALGGCSQQTQDDAELTAERAAEDTEANLDVIGEELQDGAAELSGAISEGAAELRSEIEESDDEEPGPAPITGDDLSE